MVLPPFLCPGGIQVRTLIFMYQMKVKKIVQAILSGKSREEVYNMLSPEQKETLNSLAIANGINRQQRRKLERDAKRDYIDELLELADNVLYMDYCRLFQVIQWNV